MKNPAKPIWPLCLLAAAVANLAYAETDTVADTELDAITVTGQVSRSTSPFQFGRKPSDAVFQGESFKNRSANLGDALSKEVGIHSNPFGAGAGAPIIRGQEGVRIKLLQNSSDVVDMSHLSPDHATAADTLLAQKVEIVRGAPTLLYANASPAGVVNVIDNRIPNQMPANGLEGEAALRYNPAAGDEKVASAGITFGLGNHVAVRAEGLWRRAENYSVPSLNVKPGVTLDYMPDTHNRSRVGTIGASWVGEKGHFGLSYSYRRDRYGLPAHDHTNDNARAHVIRDGKPYLVFYPHLHDETDLAPHYHGGPSGRKHADAQHELGYDFDHTKPGPWVDMNTRRVDAHGEWLDPIRGVKKVVLHLAHTRYYHDEKDAGKDVDWNPYDPYGPADNKGRANNIFKNNGFNARLEVHHQPSENFNGVWGVQYQQSRSSAWHSKILNGALKQNWMLVDNTNKQLSYFAAAQWRVRNLTFEGAVRTEKQDIPIDYDNDKLILRRGCSGWLCIRPTPDVRIPRPADYQRRATSYAASVNWDINPEYTLSFMYSHNERHPSPMELYYTGEHLATNSFEYGNKDLTLERSNNFEIGLRRRSERWNYNISLYRNNFQNYIYKQTIFQQGTLNTYRYAQSQARFYGIEAKVSYRPNDRHEITLWGDYVRGRLVNLPSYTRYDEWGLPESVHEKPDRDAPRVPPARIGVRLHSHWNDRWETTLDYTRVFNQNKVSFFESFSSTYPDDLVERPTRGHHLLNFGVAYRNQIGGARYRIYADVNNILNQKIYTHTSFLPYVPQMGRNFTFGVNMTF